MSLWAVFAVHRAVHCTWAGLAHGAVNGASLWIVCAARCVWQVIGKASAAEKDDLKKIKGPPGAALCV